jgi:hypothetical protein
VGVLTDAADEVTTLLAARRPDEIETHRTVATLAWRYGLDDLGYQALPLAGDVAEGLAVYRVRRRGSATEATVCELLVPDEEAGRARALVRAVLDDSRADYALVAGPARRTGALPWPGLGPRLTLRELAVAPPQPALTLGDIELF